jgi:hypothetical protein
MTALLIAALLSGWGLVQLCNQARYRCPTCGSGRPDDHARDCPWSSRP